VGITGPNCEKHFTDYFVFFTIGFPALNGAMALSIEYRIEFTFCDKLAQTVHFQKASLEAVPAIGSLFRAFAFSDSNAAATLHDATPIET
jgi:hypothetical protein